MKEVRRKVLLDLFAAPSTLLPMVGGMTLLLASWAQGGDLSLTVGGMAGVLGGLGMLASRMILGLERMTEEAHQYVVEKRRQAQERALDALDEKLTRDNDPRSETCLRQLRHMYGNLQEQVEGQTMSPAAYQVLEGVDRVFHVCVEQLRRSQELWEIAIRLPATGRQQLLQQRDDIVRDVQETVNHLAETMARFHQMNSQKNKSELGQLRQELNETLRVARRVDERIHELTETPTSAVRDNG